MHFFRLDQFLGPACSTLSSMQEAVQNSEARRSFSHESLMKTHGFLELGRVQR